jgi:uncharacterized protein YndB with AHSA1/START domain
MDDGRKAIIIFAAEDQKTVVTETFEPENENSREMQCQGWQAILDQFKRYAETSRDMELLHFSVLISASAQKVYQCLLGESTYREWTKAFDANSRYVGDWQKGSLMRFLGNDESGHTLGMLSRVRENRQNAFVSLEHLGMIKGTQDITTGPEIESWAGGLENYMITPVGSQVRFDVWLDSNQQFKDYFLKTWPKALQLLKETCERRSIDMRS